MEDALARGDGIITVTGPTKSGKTVLCRKVLEDEKSVWVEGGRIREEKDFWDQITGSDYAPPSISETMSTASTKDLKTGLSAELNFPGVGKLGGNAGTGGSLTSSSTSIRPYTADHKARTLKKLIADEVSLVIDNFHFVHKEVQAHIVNSLKSSIFDGLNIIIIAVPHRAFDPLAVQQEMQGRFVHLEIAQWTLDELKVIPQAAFQP
ncbi:GspE family protein [Methylobacterium iners]|uniref:GspE family protein n=1 Tax=Methylobacterium iners TaxID=418707 RepID=UPI001EE2BCFE|nr:GspE family protein [Methylobacterium iners]